MEHRDTRPAFADYLPLLTPGKIDETLRALDASTADLLEAGKGMEAAYDGKPELMRRRQQLETEIQLREAEAVMSLSNPGAPVLKNDTERTAYRHKMSADLRTQRADVEGDLAAVDTRLQSARDRYQQCQDAMLAIRAKANLQAALLGFRV